MNGRKENEPDLIWQVYHPATGTPVLKHTIHIIITVIFIILFSAEKNECLYNRIIH